MNAITRIYRMQTHPQLRAEFEPLFQSVARSTVENAAGCIGVTIGMPTPATPDEYAMISAWDTAETLTAFIGSDWHRVHIPPGMEHFVKASWVHHFTHAVGAEL